MTTEEQYHEDEERSIDVTVQIEDKHVLDLVSAILTASLPQQTKDTPKAAVKAFHQVREEIIKGMGETERGGLPIYLLKKIL